MIGTGPYQLADLGTDSITLDVFEGYWGEAPANEGINIQVYSGNSANLFNSFLTNGIDIAYQALDPEQIKRLQQGVTDDKWQVVEANGTVVNYLVLNTQQPPLDQVEVRQAIAALIQRSLLIDRILQGQAEPLYSLIPTAFAVSQPVFEYANITKARELLTQAGYSANNPITIELWHSSGSNTRAIVASTLKAIADKELNGIINFKPNSVEFATASKNLQEGIYPTFLSDWYPDFLDPDNYIQPFLACMKGSEETGCQQGASQTQGSFYYSEKMNELIDQQRQEQNPATRQAIFAQIQDLLAQDVPYIPLWQTKDYVFVQNGIDGLTLNPSQNLPFWTLAK